MGGHPYASETVVEHLNEWEERIQRETEEREGWRCAGRESSREEEDPPRGAQRREASTPIPMSDASHLLSLAVGAPVVFAQLLAGDRDHAREWEKFCRASVSCPKRSIDQHYMRSEFLRLRYPELELPKLETGVTAGGYC